MISVFFFFSWLLRWTALVVHQDTFAGDELDLFSRRPFKSSALLDSNENERNGDPHEDRHRVDTMAFATSPSTSAYMAST